MPNQLMRIVAAGAASFLLAIAQTSAVGAQETEPAAVPQTSIEDMDPEMDEEVEFPEPTLLPEDMEPVIPASELPSVNVPAEPVGSFIYVGVNQFGRWVDRPASRPYLGMNDSDLDAFQLGV